MQNRCVAEPLGWVPLYERMYQPCVKRNADREGCKGRRKGRGHRLRSLWPLPLTPRRSLLEVIGVLLQLLEDVARALADLEDVLLVAELVARGEVAAALLLAEHQRQLLLVEGQLDLDRPLPGVQA